MPRVTFIQPAIGRYSRTRYVRSWQMQPLSIAVLAAITPSSWDRSFFDDRLEEIDYDQPTDLAAISIETFTARRGYQIAAEYRRRGVPVILGGYHATFLPDEALEHGDAVCIGEAETVWDDILRDTKAGKLTGKYVADFSDTCPPTRYDRSIFGDKPYFRLALVETSRGCGFTCNFCSITAFHRACYKPRPVADVIAEVRELGAKMVFFVDDNIVGDFERATELCAALEKLHLQWVGQASVDIARNSALLDAMARSGCVGLLVGFESLNEDGLACMNKQANQGLDYATALAEFRRRGIVIYGTFMLGLPADTPATPHLTAEFATQHKLFIAAFNHVVPFPGTPLYKRMEDEGQLTSPKWWLNEEYRFGDPPFRPACGTPDQLCEWCHQARCDFYSMRNILRRARDLQANCGTLHKASLYFAMNLLLRREIRLKRGLPLGLQGGQHRVILPVISRMGIGQAAPATPSAAGGEA